MVASKVIHLRLPIAVYEKITKAVDDDGLDTTYTNYCRNLILRALLEEKQ